MSSLSRYSRIQFFCDGGLSSTALTLFANEFCCWHAFNRGNRNPNNCWFLTCIFDVMRLVRTFDKCLTGFENSFDFSSVSLYTSIE